MERIQASPTQPAGMQLEASNWKVSPGESVLTSQIRGRRQSSRPLNQISRPVSYTHLALFGLVAVDAGHALLGMGAAAPMLDDARIALRMAVDAFLGRRRNIHLRGRQARFLASAAGFQGLDQDCLLYTSRCV